MKNACFLCYRIQKAGYKNYYLAPPTIIHSKGESTDKADLKYIRAFYGQWLYLLTSITKGLKRLFKGLLFAGIGLKALLETIKLKKAF